MTCPPESQSETFKTFGAKAAVQVRLTTKRFWCNYPSTRSAILFSTGCRVREVQVANQGNIHQAIDLELLCMEIGLKLEQVLEPVGDCEDRTN